MAAMGVFSSFRKDLCWLSRAKGITARDLTFVCSPIQNLDWEYVWPHFEKHSLSVIKSVYISLIIGPRGLVCEANP